MSLHRLDPRQAGTGAKPDVEVGEWASFGFWYRRLGTYTRMQHGDYETAAAALAAARQAAGFGDVAEQPCVAFANQPTGNAKRYGCQPSDYVCADCRWSRDAHKAVQS